MIERRALAVEPYDTDILAIGALVGDLNAYVGAPAKTSRVIDPRSYGLDGAATGINDGLIVHESALAIAELFGSVC